MMSKVSKSKTNPNPIQYIICVFWIAVCGNPVNLEQVYGTWKGEFQSKEYLIEFRTDNTVDIIIRDDAKESDEDVTGDFELDFSKQPTALSISNIPQLNHPLYTIMEMRGNDEIIMAPFSPRWRLRPVSLIEQGNLVLKRL